MSNLRLLLVVLLIPIAIIPMLLSLSRSGGIPIFMFNDLVSFLLVYGITFSLYLSSANNKVYINLKSIDIKFNYLKEMFLFSAFIGTTIGLSFMWSGSGDPKSAEIGSLWMILGYSMAVALLSDAYGVLYYLSSSFFQYYLEYQSDFKDKITRKYSSNKIITLVLMFIPLIILSMAINLAMSNTSVTINSFLSNFGEIIITYIFILLLCSIMLIKSNFKIIIKSFMNNILEDYEIIETINLLKKLSRLISILTGLNTLIGLVVGGWLFGSKNLHINYAFSFICIQFYISTIFIMYLRTFIFRLNLDLVESNYLQIENDKYFIFKYTLPIYFVIQVVSGFGFLIMIFR